MDEAAVKLAQIVNQDDFVSKHGKSNHQLWNELCDLISKNPSKIKSLNVDAIIRGGLRRYTDQLGPLWNSLADYYVRSGLFERVRESPALFSIKFTYSRSCIAIKRLNFCCFYRPEISMRKLFRRYLPSGILLKCLTRMRNLKN